MTDGQTQDEPPSEAQKVYEYRCERFRELKFTPRTSRILAEKEADWHEAEKLLKRGWPHGTVAKLVTPLER